MTEQNLVFLVAKIVRNRQLKEPRSYKDNVYVYTKGY